MAVFGAGPAGLKAAEVMASAGLTVTVYDRMPSPARKFLMAGRGGLNLTHSEPLSSFLQRYSGDAAQIQECVMAFTPDQAVAWANALGQETFVGSSGRIFPKAMKASPLLRAWLQRLAQLGVTLKTRHTWIGFDVSGSPIVETPDGLCESVPADATILAFGGASWPKLGSNGAWAPLLSATGISITLLTPSNCGVRTSWSDLFSQKFAGSALKRIAVTVSKTTRRGEAMITSGGLEGGAIYALGPALRAALASHGSPTVTIDLKPDVSVADIAERVSRSRGSNSQSNHIRKTLALDPAAVALLREPGPLPTTPEVLAALVKAVPVKVNGLASLERAISTAGGVSFSELDANLMLHTIPGVFCAGEMLDWDAPTGGYLLQGCLDSGHAAAQGALKWLESRAKT